MPPRTCIGLSKFQERPSGASGIQENLLAAGTPPWTPLGELAVLPLTPSPQEPYFRRRPFEAVVSALDPK